MWSSFWLLGIESHDFSQAEKERTACQAVQIHKMTTTFTLKSWMKKCHFVTLLSFAKKVAEQ